MLHLRTAYNLLGLFVFIITSHSIATFDVKVLLYKTSSKNPESATINLQSDTGFILSDHPYLIQGYEYPGRMLTLTCKHDTLFLNGKQLKEQRLYISPALSHTHIVQLHSQVSCWLESCRLEIKKLSEVLYPLFDDIVQSDQSLQLDRYDVVNQYAQTVLNLFFEDTFRSLPQPMTVTLEKIDQYIQQFVGQKAQNMLLEGLNNKHLTTQHRQDLLKDKKKRYLFFDKELYGIVSALLHDFIITLPRKILEQMLGCRVDMISYEGSKYVGSFIIYQDKKVVYLINNLDIEDYLLSVVRHEGWPGWPVEAKKVIAVACRTYLVWQVLQAQKLDRPYHIENGIKHQRYKGYHSCAQIQQALDETKDLIVTYGGKPACCMYDACCGGIVPAHIDDNGHKNFSYLARSYPCSFCKGYKIYDWSFDISGDQALQRLKKEFTKLEKISDIKVLKKDKAGLVKKVSILAGSRKILITEKKMKLLFPEIRSYCFDITKGHKRYIIQGRGYGHHRGLCQWGACHLIKQQHWNFIEVLQFYYPGTTLMKLSYKR